MEHIVFTKENGAATITMARGKANAFNTAMVNELNAAMEDARADDGVKVVVITSNRPRFFSAGFDTNEVFGYTREQMEEYLTGYGGLVHRVFHFPKPTLAVMPGHSFAGGAIVALGCDFRLWVDGEYGYALNEVNVGVVIPPHLFAMLKDAAGPAWARRMVLTGDPVNPRQALAIGLVDEVVEESKLTEAAFKWAALLMTKAGPAYTAIKANIRKANGHDASSAHYLTPDVASWFTPEAEARKQAIRDKLKK